MSKTLALITMTVIAATQVASATDYIVVFKGSESATGFEVGGNNLLHLNTALGAIPAAGGTVTADLTRQAGVAIAASSSAGFADLLRASPLVEEVGEDRAFALSEEPSLPLDPNAVQAPGPGEDRYEFAQWGMQDIRADQARAVQMGSPSVDVAVLDTGIDATHEDFTSAGVSNIDRVRARSFVPEAPDPLADVFEHGTGVAGVIAARKNGVGIVGVAPNVTIVPIKIAEDDGHIRPSAAVQGITYAGDIQADVINMSFYIDDEAPGVSTAFKCSSDPEQRAYRRATERAIRYARKRGALPIAAAGNHGVDLTAFPFEDPECDRIPQETPGVIAAGGLRAIRDGGTLVPYSDRGLGVVDVVAPAGWFGPIEACPDRSGFTLTTAPGSQYVCGLGTSFAAPHASGVAALIISQFGTLGADGDMKMAPDSVESLLLRSAVDTGPLGEDLCHGLGRVHALRAVQGETVAQHEQRVCYPAPRAASSCPGPQITDWGGDAMPGYVLNPPDTNDVIAPENASSAEDILSATFTAAGPELLQITLTLADLADLSMTTGTLWAVYFDAPNGRYSAQAEVVGDPATVTYQLRQTDESDPQLDLLPEGHCTPIGGDEIGTRCWVIEGTFNEVPNSIVLNVPLVRIGSPVAGSPLERLAAVTYDTLAGVGSNNGNGQTTSSPDRPGGDDRAGNADTVFNFNDNSFGAKHFGADYKIGEVCDATAP